MREISRGCEDGRLAARPASSVDPQRVGVAATAVAVTVAARRDTDVTATCRGGRIVVGQWH